MIDLSKIMRCIAINENLRKMYMENVYFKRTIDIISNNNLNEKQLLDIIANLCDIISTCQNETIKFMKESEIKIDKLTQNLINNIKENTNLCDTFACYEDCQSCVSKYLKHLEKKGNNKNE